MLRMAARNGHVLLRVTWRRLRARATTRQVAAVTGTCYNGSRGGGYWRGATGHAAAVAVSGRQAPRGFLMASAAAVSIASEYARVKLACIRAQAGYV